MSMLGRMFGFGRSEQYDRGIHLFDQGRYEEAIEILSQVASDGRGDVLTQRLASFYVAEAYANLGADSLQKQQYAKAQADLRKALQINPHYADLQFHYARASLKAGDIEESIAALDKALAINPKFAKAHFLRGLALFGAGRRDEGMSAVREAFALDPVYQAEQVAQAFTAFEAEDFSRVQALLEQVAETDTDDISFHTNLGGEYFRRGLFAEAADEFRHALALNPNYADVRNHLGIALNAEEQYDAAIREFRQALAINPDYIEARSNLALTLRTAGRDEEANVEFAWILARDPENVIARSHLSA